MRLETKLTDNQVLEIEYQNDLILRANATNIINLYIYDVDNLPVDITGAIIRLIIKENPTDLDISAGIDLLITSSNLTNPMSGHTKLEITQDSATDLLGNYIYQIIITLETGKVYLLSEGTICFRRSLTDIV